MATSFRLSICGVHIGAIWWIRLNRACDSAMRRYVKLLWSLVVFLTNYMSYANGIHSEVVLVILYPVWLHYAVCTCVVYSLTEKRKRDQLNNRNSSDCVLWRCVVRVFCYIRTCRFTCCTCLPMSACVALLLGQRMLCFDKRLILSMSLLRLVFLPSNSSVTRLPKNTEFIRNISLGFCAFWKVIKSPGMLLFKFQCHGTSWKISLVWTLYGNTPEFTI